MPADTFQSEEKRRTVRAFALYEEVGRDRPHGGERYRAVPVDHPSATKWREGCCTAVEMALTRGAIKTCMDSDNRDHLGFYIEAERNYRGEDETDAERRIRIEFCPLCGGELVFLIVRHFKRSYTSRRVKETVEKTEWDHKDVEVPVPGVSE